MPSPGTEGSRSSRDGPNPAKLHSPLAAALCKTIRQRTAAQKGRRPQPYPAQQGADCLGGTLREHGQTAAPAAVQLDDIPEHLRQVSIWSQQQAVQIAQHQRIS